MKAIILAALVSASSPATPATEPFPWTNWNQLKTEVSVGGHGGECSEIGHVLSLTVTRGEAGPGFQMWNIMTPATEPSRWAAVKFVGTYAEPVMIFVGTSTSNNDIIVQTAKRYVPGSDVNLCELLRK